MFEMIQMLQDKRSPSVRNSNIPTENDKDARSNNEGKDLSLPDGAPCAS
ncbi:16243_t:CDS:2, partial [Cetraspora pellucida]